VRNNNVNVKLEGLVIDLAVCLGGDGTLLRLNSLFPMSVPPIVAFDLGTLGFLTPFNVNEYQTVLEKVLYSESPITLRHRLVSNVIRRNKESLGSSWKGEIEQFVCLNEFVLDRGTSAYLTNINLSCDDHLITKIQGDGVICSTATGSTAYSLSAGGSCLHPLVPAICLTPICPHTLSFRPVIFPDCVNLKLEIPDDAQSQAYFSSDGTSRIPILPGDYIEIQMSKFPAPVIHKKAKFTHEWFQSLATCLNWNQRK